MSILKNSIKGNFTIIQNEIFNYDISHHSFKLYIYLLSRPDNWQIYNKQIAEKLKISESKITKSWKELIDKKLITREKRKNEQNKYLGGYDYHMLLIYPETHNLLDSGNYQIREKNSYNNIDINNKIDLSTNIKENKTKEKKKIYDNFDYTGFNEQESILIKEWFIYREEMRKPYKTNSSLSALRKLLLSKKNNNSIIDAIKNSMAMGYTGIFFPSQKNIKNNIDLVGDKNKYKKIYEF